ncbi:MAG: substrate-binding domain-containing protein [Cyanobacteria bacterium J06607_10]
MVNRKTASAITIAALLTCAMPVRSTGLSLLAPIVAQSTPTFSLPTSVPENTKVRISSSSDNMNAISGALKSGFEGEYANSEVNIATKTAQEAIQDVLNDNADLAAISRPLTAAEKAQGLIEIPVRREKIAIVVPVGSTFDKSITGSQFAQIFRGEIKDWSEIGGEAGPIKLIDRPATSETRQALSPYPVFTTAPFESAAAATIATDTTDALVSSLVPNSIGYTLVGELESQPKIKAIQLHQTLPTDPRYPFSQPYSFVYAGGASPAVSAFLGYATGNPGQAAINDAGISGTGLIPDASGEGAGATTTATADTATGSANGADGGSTDGTAADSATDNDADSATNSANSETAAGADGAAANGADGNASGENGAVADGSGENGTGNGTTATLDGNSADGTGNGADGDGTAAVGNSDAAGGIGNLSGRGSWWWLLLPLAGLALLVWAAGKRGNEEDTGYIASADSDDRIRSEFEGDKVGVGAGLGSRTKAGIGRMSAGGAAIAGGAAATGLGLAGRLKNQAGEVTMDLQEGVSGSVRGGIDGVRGGVDSLKGDAQSGLAGIRSNIQGGVDSAKGTAQAGLDDVKGSVQGIRGSVQGGIDSARGNIQGSIDSAKGNVQGSINGMGTAASSGSNAVDNVRSTVQGSVDGIKADVQSGIDNVQTQAQTAGSSWLDRAKQRINEATEQIKDTAEDVKDDVTKNN